MDQWILQPQWHLQDRRGIVLHLLRARLLHQLQPQVTVRLEKERIKVQLIPLQCMCQVQMLMTERRNPLFADSGRASSSSSPTVSEILIREREDRTESDISRVNVSHSVDDRSGRPDDNQANKNPKPNKKESKKEQSDSLYSEIPVWLQEFRENLVDDRVLEHRDSRASFSHEVPLERTSKRSEDLGKHSVKLISLKTEIAESVRGPKLQGPCAEDAMAEPYLVQKLLVT